MKSAIILVALSLTGCATQHVSNESQEPATSEEAVVDSTSSVNLPGVLNGPPTPITAPVQEEPKRSRAYRWAPRILMAVAVIAAYSTLRGSNNYSPSGASDGCQSGWEGPAPPGSIIFPVPTGGPGDPVTCPLGP